MPLPERPKRVTPDPYNPLSLAEEIEDTEEDFGAEDFDTESAEATEEPASAPPVIVHTVQDIPASTATATTPEQLFEQFAQEYALPDSGNDEGWEDTPETKGPTLVSSDLRPTLPTEPRSAFASDDQLAEEDEFDVVRIPADLPQDIRESAELLIEVIRSDDYSEVLLNGPNEVTVKQDGGRYHLPEIKFQTVEYYHRVLNEVILPFTDTSDRISEESYLVEGQLDLPIYDEYGNEETSRMARVHIITPPVVKHSKVTIAKKSRKSLQLDDLVKNQSATRNMVEFLKACAKGRATVIFSGVSGAGKTTMLEAISAHFDQNDRVIVTEDTRELRLPIADTVYLTASSNRPGATAEEIVTLEWLVRATNRMRPDRIIVGEVRGPEMSEFLIAANSGADGSMLTIHASDPRRALDKMLSLAMRASGSKNETSVRRDIANTVQIIVQLTLVDGKHIVSNIEEISNTIRQDTGAIASTPIFEYDRNTGRFMARNRPSEALLGFLAQRGVKTDIAWFQ